MKLYTKNVMLAAAIISALALTSCADANRLIVPNGVSRVAINQVEVKKLVPVKVTAETDVSEALTVPKKSGSTSIEGRTVKIEWKVDANMALRDNITAWALSSGWVAPEWLVTDDYRTPKTTYIEGEFPEVLKQISDNSGLNICVTRNPKNIKITNHNIPCKD